MSSAWERKPFFVGGAESLSRDLKADGTVPLTANWNVGAFTLTGLNLTASPTLSAEALTNVAGWTAAGNWTHVGTTWSHTTGSATALTATGETAIVAGTKYEITMVLTTSTAGGGLAMQLGGQSFAVVSTGAPTTYTYNVTALDTSALSITPTSGTWVGSLTISVKLKAAATGIMTNEGVTQNSGQYLFPYGNVSYPSLALGTSTYGFYRDNLNALAISLAGTRSFRFTSTGLSITLNGGITLGSSGDLFLWREAAATLRLGFTTAAQTIKSPDGDGTDQAGGSMTLAGGKSTGTGLGGAVYIATSPAAAGTGSAVNALVNRLSIASDGTVAALGVQSQATNIKQATVAVTTTAAATATATNLIPAGCLCIGVSTRVLTAVTGDAGFTGFNIGDGTDPDMFGANVSPSLNATTTLANSTITAPVINTSAAKSVVLTQVGGTTFNAGGVVRITVHYIDLTAPTT
jgi:hypothetical protein